MEERLKLFLRKEWKVPLKFESGEYKAVRMTFYERAIANAQSADSSENRWAGASDDEIWGGNGVHEEGHTNPTQIELDLQEGNEFLHDKEKTVPINQEIDFRKEYHENNPGRGNSGTWKDNYKKKGYNTDDKEDGGDGNGGTDDKKKEKGDGNDGGDGDNGNSGSGTGGGDDK